MDTRTIPQNALVSGISAMASHLSNAQPDTTFLHLITYKSPSVEVLQKLMLNSLSAEYALRVTSLVNDNEYLEQSAAWTFPQVYYSMLFSARAFLLTTGQNEANEENVRTLIGTGVVRGYYPEAIGFYACGPFGSYKINRLPFAQYDTESQAPTNENIWQFDIGRLLWSTRGRQYQAVRSRMGFPQGNLSLEANKEVSKNMGYTTFFDIITRLGRQAADTLDLTGTSVAEFHRNLLVIVNYVNWVHEAHICWAIGKDAFLKIIDGLPYHLQNEYLQTRFTSILSA